MKRKLKEKKGRKEEREKRERREREEREKRRETLISKLSKIACNKSEGERTEGKAERKKSISLCISTEFEFVNLYK